MTTLPSPDRTIVGKLTGDQTRRHFIKGIAAAGASTTAAVALDATGVTHIFSGEEADAATSAFSDFKATAVERGDAFVAPEGYDVQVLIKWLDEFKNTDGTTLKYGFNCDFLAYFPINGSQEGLIFVNHEYPEPFFIHGNKTANITTAQFLQEAEAVGNSIVHIKKKSDGSGRWDIVSPSAYNRRITGRTPVCAFTGPLANNPSFPGIGATSNGSLANCSGGITPWGTALSCEENYSFYPELDPGDYGWQRSVTGTDDYYDGNGKSATAPATWPADGGNGAAPLPAGSPGPAKYGWVVETDPYDPNFQPRKHTALGRFRHENTAFRQITGKKFVLYMGDDLANAGVYKFVSDREFIPGNRSNNLQILAEGKLYIASFSPEGRRRYSSPNGGALLTAPQGDGFWREVSVNELVDTQVLIRDAVGGTAFDTSYATNRPEDVEVDTDGTVYIAFTNNGGVNDPHGSIRRLREADNDPTRVGNTPGARFSWEDYAVGGPGAGETRFSSPDNLTFDNAGNLWVVTDISSTSLNKPSGAGVEYNYHGNNAVFMVPRSGPGTGTAFRFGTAPLESEATGPYFTPDESTLFINIQHPGEVSGDNVRNPGNDPNNPLTFTSYWPEGNKTLGQNPTKPKPSTLAIIKTPVGAPSSQNVVPTPSGGNSNAATPTPPPALGPDTDPPGLALTLRSGGVKKASLLRGLVVTGQVDEASQVIVQASVSFAKPRARKKTKAKLEVSAAATASLGRATENVGAGQQFSIRLKPSSSAVAKLRRARRLSVKLRVTAIDAAGNRVVSNRRLKVT